METAHLRAATTARATVQENDGLPIGISALLVIQLVAIVDLERAGVEGFGLRVKRAHDGGIQ